MKLFFKHIIDICYDKEIGLKKRIIISILFIVFGLVIMTWFLYRLFKVDGHWNIHHKINLPEAGQIGDFIGGFSGTLFTLVGVVLLFETLALQRKELSESRMVFEKQQFENTFFNLLNLYQGVVKSLHFDFIDFGSERIYNGKDFFEQQKKRFYNDFQSQGSYSKNRKQATLNYIEFYVTTKEQTAHYFRTIYRIFRFISNSSFSEKEKMNYAKIVRAQLSESELFFLHYNAYTDYGIKFRELINQFNIIKHLPTLEKVEFIDYAGQLQQMEKNGVGLVLDDLKYFIKTAISEGKEGYKTYLQGSIALKVTSENSSTFKLLVIKKENMLINTTYQQGYGLGNFDLAKTEEFFIDYINDLISYSNYFDFNGRELSITSTSSTNLQTSKSTIEITVSKRNSQQIKFN